MKTLHPATTQSYIWRDNVSKTKHRGKNR